MIIGFEVVIIGFGFFLYVTKYFVLGIISWFFEFLKLMFFIIVNYYVDVSLNFQIFLGNKINCFFK